MNFRKHRDKRRNGLEIHAMLIAINKFASRILRQHIFRWDIED